MYNHIFQNQRKTMERDNDHGYKQEIEHDWESSLERTNLHLGKDAGEGQQWEKYVEEHGIPLLGEKQGVQSKNQEFEDQVQEGIEEAKRAR